jgi:DNA-binding CsgD family transcriptional regulator
MAGNSPERVSRNVESTLTIETWDGLGTPSEREDDVCLAGFGGRSRVVKGGGNQSWNGRPRAAAGGADGSGWLRGATALAALDTALNAIDAPAIVVDLGGEVLHANTNAQILLEQDGPGVSRSLAEAIAGASADDSWDLTPLQGTEQRHGFLAVKRGSKDQVPIRDPLRMASQRWRLTARQTDVLRWLAHGLTNGLIAQTLGITERTVEFHLKGIFDKAGVDNRTTLLVKLLEP